MTEPSIPETSGSKVPPSPQQVNFIHSRSDRDSSKISQHHTLGLDANQASPGNHTHDGRNSKLPLEDRVTGFPLVADSSYNQSQMQAVIDALIELGAS